MDKSLFKSVSNLSASLQMFEPSYDSRALENTLKLNSMNNFNNFQFQPHQPLGGSGMDATPRLREPQRPAFVSPQEWDGSNTGLQSLFNKIREINMRRNRFPSYLANQYYNGGQTASTQQERYLQYDELIKKVGRAEDDDGGFMAYIPIGGQSQPAYRGDDWLETKECYLGRIPKTINVSMSGYDPGSTSKVYMRNPDYDPNSPIGRLFNDFLVAIHSNPIRVVPRQLNGKEVYELYGEGFLDNYGKVPKDENGVYSEAYASATGICDLQTDLNNLFPGMGYEHGGFEYDAKRAHLLATVSRGVLDEIGLAYAPMDSALFADLDKYREKGTDCFLNPDLIPSIDDRDNYIKRLREYFKYMNPYRHAGMSKGHLSYSRLVH